MADDSGANKMAEGGDQENKHDGDKPKEVNPGESGTVVEDAGPAVAAAMNATTVEPSSNDVAPNNATGEEMSKEDAKPEPVSTEDAKQEDFTAEPDNIEKLDRPTDIESKDPAPTSEEKEDVTPDPDIPGQPEDSTDKEPKDPVQTSDDPAIPPESKEDVTPEPNNLEQRDHSMDTESKDSAPAQDPAQAPEVAAVPPVADSREIPITSTWLNPQIGCSNSPVSAGGTPRKKQVAAKTVLRMAEKTTPRKRPAAKTVKRIAEKRRESSAATLEEATPAKNSEKADKKGPPKKKARVAKTTASATRAPNPQVWEGAPDDPLEGGWPPGWVKRKFARKSGNTKGHLDRYWYSPKENYKLRSMAEVRRFMQALQESGGDEQYAWKVVKKRSG